MQVVLLTVGKPKQAYVDQGLKDYAARLKAHGGCALEWVKPEKGSKARGPAQVMAKEGERLLARVDARDQLWALDRQGSAWTSRGWARRLDQARQLGVARLVLVVGGPWGLDGALLARAQQRVSLGPPTLPHELAALVALEQLYRAHTILAGTPYHHEG